MGKLDLFKFVNILDRQKKKCSSNEPKSGVPVQAKAELLYLQGDAFYSSNNVADTLSSCEKKIRKSE